MQDAKYAVPLQYFGFGDQIFTANLMHKFKDAGYEVIYPVMAQNVEALQFAYPEFTFIDYKTQLIDYNNKTDHIEGECRFLPIRFADQILKVPYSQCMRAKYDLYGFNWHDWRNTMFKRNEAKERELYDKFALDKFQNGYKLISPYFGSNSQYELDIDLMDTLPTVKLSSLDGYSLFDWSYIIENATYIHAASSSILYLLELLDLKAKEIHLYSRRPIEPHFDNVSYIFTKDYILHV